MGARYGHGRFGFVALVPGYRGPGTGAHFERLSSRPTTGRRRRWSVRRWVPPQTLLPFCIPMISGVKILYKG